METEPVRLARRLIQEGEKSEQFFQLLPPEFLEKELYTDGSHWKVGQLMAHFLATELGITALIKSILAGNPGSPEDFNIDRYNEKKISELRDLSLVELTGRFHTARQNSAELVARLTEDQLKLEGRHPYLGITRIEDIVKLLYRHTQIHQRDIRRLQVGSDVSPENSLV